MGLCAPIPSGSKEGEFEDQPLGDGLVSTDDAVGHRSCAGGADDAEIASDGLAAGIRLEIGAAIPSTFVSLGINGVETAVGVDSSPGARFVAWIASSELPAWLEASPEGRLCASCVGKLGNGLNGTGSTMGGRATRDGKAERDPGVFLAELFGAGVLVAAAVFPGCADVFAGDAGSGAVVSVSGDCEN